MPDTPDFAAVAALVGDATRGRMLAALMDGQARTATELAIEGDVTPSTASSHLARLGCAGLVTITRRGRNRYFRIATAEVAAALEGLMHIAPHAAPRPVGPGPRDDRLRRARVCYDHLAGRSAVRLLERLREKRLIGGQEGGMALTAAGEEWCARIGIDLAALRAKRRRLCRPCLDWSERRAHLAGALGAALLERLLALRYARREPDSRVLVLSARGESFIERLEPVR